MSIAEEYLIPVTSGDTLVITGLAIPVMSGAATLPGKEGLSRAGAIPKFFGGAQGRITIRPGGLKWGCMNMDTYETWTLTTPRHHQESQYELPGVMETVQEEPGLGPVRESDLTRYYLDTRLEILECGCDRMMQTIEATLTAIPQTVADAIQRALPGVPVRPTSSCCTSLGLFSPSIKKRQQDIIRFLEANKIEFEEVDITMSEDQRRWMYKHIPPDKQPAQGNPLPPQIFSDDQYCGGSCPATSGRLTGGE
ncbi:UNVERIFIED_CONTAM: hypothetical protein K2H54_065375 [Gekko kuhli]